MQVAEVVLPLPLDKLFHYFIPKEWMGSVRPGMRVLVQFGARKEYAAVVARVLETEEQLELKPILNVLDEHPVVLEHQLLQWSWMSSYYMAPIGDVMNAALPPGLKLSSQSIVVLDQDVLPDEAQLSDALFTLYESLRSNQKLSLDEVRSILGVKNPMPLVQKALEQGWAILEEELKKVSKAKRRKLIRLTAHSLANLDTAFDKTARSESQTAALLALVNECGVKNSFADRKAFEKKHKVATAQSRALIAKGIAEEVEEVDGTTAAAAPQTEIHLSSAQQEALEGIREGFAQKSRSPSWGDGLGKNRNIYSHDQRGPG